MTDRLGPQTRLQPINLPGAEVSYLCRLDLGLPPDAVLRALIAETPWRQENVTLWGKTYRQPRLIAWYGDPGRRYRYSGVVLDPLPWTDRILDVKLRVEDAVAHTFNSVLVNYYRDQNDSMGMHSDDEKELGERPVIASVSLGADRTLVFKHRSDRDEKPSKLSLASGSLLLMKGETQKNYKHGIPKTARHVGPRVNLTFRIVHPVTPAPASLQAGR